jgi:DNA repair protein RadA/Sms
MSKEKTIFACSKCGAQSPKWQGRCLECGAWGTLIEETVAVAKNDTALPAKAEATINLKNLSGNNQKESTNIKEVDNVLGGGLTKGSFVLLGGDPGIGKTTLAMQIADKFKNVLYASGEESGEQVRDRAERLKVNLDSLQFLNQTDIDKVIATAKALQPSLLIIDSIQTVYSDEASGSPGSVSQITASASKLMELAKKHNITTIIIGHVTKDGIVAGPKTLEHLVDVVLYLENDNQQYYKILRAVKNRFGAVGEIGIFEMSVGGLQELPEAGGLFLDKNLDDRKPGISASIIIEGSRPFVIEVQSLITKTVFGYPVRKANGFDLNRLQMILAVISKYLKINLGSHDVYLNIAGGLKTKDTAVDMAVICSLLSAYSDKLWPEKTVALGEVGLSGEVRNVGQIEKRLKEAEKLGFKNFFISAGTPVKAKDNIKTIKNISQLADLIGK